MGDSVGQINLGLDINQKSFNSQLQGISKGAERSVGSAFSGLGKMIGVALGTAAIVSFTKSCLDLGSDLAEVQNVVDVTFGSMSKQVNEFASSAIETFGLSETVAKKMMGTYGAMSKSFGFSTSQAFDMSKAITGLTADVASFYNLNTDEAYTKMKSIWTGETESLKELGVVMTQTALDQYALNNGFGKTTAKMTEQEKVMLRYQFVQSQLASANGDFARTSDGWANQIRVLTLRYEGLKATLGQGFINLFTPIVKSINVLLAKLSTLANVFVKVTELITGKKSQGVATSINEVAAAGTGLDTATDSANGLGSAISDAGKSAKKAAKEALGLSSFDKLNNISDTSSDSGSGSGGSSGTSSGVGLSDITTGGTMLDDVEVNPAIEDAINKIKTAIQPTIDALGNLKTALIPFKDFVVQGLMDFYNNFLIPVASWTLGKGLPTLINVLADGLAKINWKPINVALANFWTELAKFDINIGEGLLWIWEHVLVPFGTWTANNVVPNFIQGLANVISIANGIITALQPLGVWLWDKFLQPLAKWTGGVVAKVLDTIVSALGGISTWISNNEGAVRGITIALGLFFAAWEVATLTEFIINAGGVVGVLGNMLTAFKTLTIAKVADKAETLAIGALYVKDFIVKIAQGTAALVQQGVQWIASTAMKVADTAATVASTVATTAATVATTAFGVALSVLTSPITLVIAAIAALVGGIILLIKNWDTVKDVASKCWDSIKSTVSAGVDKIKALFNVIVDFVKNNWQGLLLLIVNPFAGAFKLIYDNCATFRNTINTLLTEVKGFFAGLWTGITEIFKNVGTWFGEKFTAACTNIKAGFNGIGSFFTGVWSNIKGAFGNVSDWFKNTFSKAWKAVKDVFSSGGKVFDGIKDGILNGLKSVINALIGGINKVISIPFEGLNNALTKIKNIDILGAKPFNFISTISTPKIPALAQGGYVKANTPQLAMIGDNRHHGEVVAPEDKLQSLLDKAVSAGGAGRLEMLEIMALLRDILNVLKIIGDKDLIAYITSSELFKSLQREAKDYTYKTGKPAF